MCPFNPNANHYKKNKKDIDSVFHHFANIFLYGTATMETQIDVDCATLTLNYLDCECMLSSVNNCLPLNRNGTRVEFSVLPSKFLMGGWDL